MKKLIIFAVFVSLLSACEKKPVEISQTETVVEEIIVVQPEPEVPEPEPEVPEPVASEVPPVTGEQVYRALQRGAVREFTGDGVVKLEAYVEDAGIRERRPVADIGAITGGKLALSLPEEMDPSYFTEETGLILEIPERLRDPADSRLFGVQDFGVYDADGLPLGRIALARSRQRQPRAQASGAAPRGPASAAAPAGPPPAAPPPPERRERQPGERPKAQMAAAAYSVVYFYADKDLRAAGWYKFNDDVNVLAVAARQGWNRLLWQTIPGTEETPARSLCLTNFAEAPVDLRWVYYPDTPDTPAAEEAPVLTAEEQERLEKRRTEQAKRGEAELAGARERRRAAREKADAETLAAAAAALENAEAEAQADARKIAEVEAQQKTAEALAALEKQNAELEAERKKLAEAEAETKRQNAELEAERKKLAEAEAETKRLNAELEAMKKRAAEAEAAAALAAKKQADDAAAQQKAAEAEAEKKRLAEAEAAAKQKAAEAAAKAEAEKKRLAEAEAAAKQKAAEAEAEKKRLAEAEAAAQQKAAEAEVEKKRLAEAEAARKKAEAEAAAKKKAEEEALRKAELAAAEAKKKAEEEEAARLAAAKYHVGDTGPAGGIVFYDKGEISDGWRYLEAAPADLGMLIWGIKGANVVTSAKVGEGKKNSQTITASLAGTQYAAMTANIGAPACIDYLYRGYEGWFMPSLGELRLLYKNLADKDLGGFSDTWYWSSTQHDSGAVDFNSQYGQCVNMGDGKEYGWCKNTAAALVRPIRAFTGDEPPVVYVPPKYKVGDKGPAGGVVIYDQGKVKNGWRYIEAAPAALEGVFAWGSAEDLPGTSTALGSGQENTALIAQKYAGAAREAAACEVSGLGGWFLPSRDEFTLIVKNARSLLSGEYWTSSQAPGNGAFAYTSGGGGLLKTQRAKVHPLRFFTE